MPALWIFLSILLSSQVQGKKCRALALEGGGSYGSYQAGAMMGMIDNLPAEEVAWDVVTGVSAGALNAGAVSQFAKGDEQALKPFLYSLWNNVTFAEVMKNWPLGPIDGLLAKSSLFDDSPLKETLTKAMSLGIHRNITVGSTNLDLGIFQHFNESVGSKEIPEACLCSASIPAVFPFQHFQGRYWCDGGVIDNLDTFHAVERCLEEVPEEDIVVDTIFCDYNHFDDRASNYTTMGVFSRRHQLTGYDKNMWFLYYARLAYPKVNFRYVIKPSKKLAGITFVDFQHKPIMENMQIGISDAKNIVTGRSNVEEAVQEFRATPNRRYFAHKA